MGRFIGGFVLPLLLLTAALLNWSLISLGNLLASLLILFTPPKRGFQSRGRTLLWFIIFFSFLVILSQVTFLITWAIVCGSCNEEEPWWAKLLGFLIMETWRSPIVIYLLIVQLLVAITAFIELHESRLGLFTQTSTLFGSFSLAFNRIGSHVKVAFCLLLPAVQLVVGISYSSWVSLPFFVCSCVGLVDWSLTSNFHGLFRWWRPLWMYGGFSIFLLYIYQLPLGFPKFFSMIGEFIGLYKISATSEWTQICSCISLVIFCFMLSFVKFDLEEMDSIMSISEGNLTEHLLPLKDSFFVRESRSGVRHTNVLLRGAVFRTFSINFFTYGVPDMDIWEMVGLWHYSIPGFFMLAQFCLGVLVALGNLVNNSVFLYISDEDHQTSNGDPTPEVKEETKVLIVATIAWGLRKCSRAIMLVLIFLIAMKPGFIHAIYMIFFFFYLLSHDIGNKVRQTLLLLCEIHFALLYSLQITPIYRALEKSGSISREILSQLGLHEHNTAWDFVEIAFLACFCAVHKHGYKLLFSFSAIVQHTPCPPVGFSILKAERKVASYLSAIGQKFLSLYRSLGTYIAFVTILITVYMARPNFISFGFIFLLLFWITGRQLVEKTKRRLWFPLKAYSIMMFILIYSLSIFPTFEAWVSTKVDLYANLGYNPQASLLENVSESLAITIVMQLYSYERRQSRYRTLEDPNRMQFGIIGFIRRLLIWHSQKILFAAMFYAAISPISAFGFLYLLGIVVCSILPKASRVPSKTFLVYTGFLVTIEYLFQMLGKYAEMFPDQKLHSLSVFLGLKVYEPGIWGVEAGLRAKVLVVAACTLQYNVFYWLEMMPSWLSGVGQWEEPCPLFFSEQDVLPVVNTPNQETDPRKGIRTSSSWPSVSDAATKIGVPESSSRRYLFGFIWGSGNESHKWNKKRVLDLRKERFEMQKTSLKVYLKFWMENMFILFGLEITMIALLLASFALLNGISMLYIASLAACVLLGRQFIRKGWPVFVFLFATVLVLEYFAIWRNKIPSSKPPPSENAMHCHDCWRRSDMYFSYCRDCWLGLTVDDPRVLTSYFFVFMLACFKLRADRFGSFSGSFTYRQMISQRKNAFVWRDLSFETKSMWTFLDYLRLYCYCHLLDLVLALILITGTFEYDILHLGYLAFALIFFRMRLTILKKKNQIFKWLRIYNFAVIVLSLAYQSPFVGAFNDGKCETVDYIYEVIGFYKYDYGFRITSRSALVEIIIFILVSLQSYMFASEEFDYVFRYLEAEQIGAIVREQEKKAAWKTAQLQYIREAEEMKRQRNLQVEKMKSEMLDLQIQLQSMDPAPAPGPIASSDYSPHREGLRRRRSTDPTALNLDNEDGTPNKQKSDAFVDSLFPFESLSTLGSPKKTSLCEITEFEEDALEIQKKNKLPKRENSLISAVQLIGDGVSQVQSIGNQAVTNLANYFNIPHEDSDSDLDIPSSSVKIEKQSDPEHQNDGYMAFNSSNSMHSDRSRTNSDSPSIHIAQIFRHIWAQMRSNNDVVCYCCFLLVFLWNFSLLSMVYLAALFLYALCVNTGPSYTFWVVMLIYTEFYILIQYMYQIIIQHCDFTIQLAFLPELGFPSRKISSSFVISLLPLFLVYLFTLIQSSITAKDSELVSSTEFSSLTRGIVNQNELLLSSSWRENAQKIVQLTKNSAKLIIRNCTRYWKSLTQEAESPPYLVQVSIDVHLWPEDGIQPSRIESGINELLRFVHDERCKESDPLTCPCASSVQVQSIERSKESSNIALAVFEVVYASPREECTLTERYKSLTPAADVAKEITEAQRAKLFEKVGFPYSIISVIGGGKREIDLYAYTFGADLAVFFLVAIFYQSVIKNKSELLDVYQLEDQFPKEFVFILMVIFFLIVLDRIIYLCSFATGKVIFYICNLVLFTYSVTAYAWTTKPSQQNAAGFALRALEDINASLYLVKCDSDLNRANHKQGEKQTRVTKFCNGICLFFILMCVIWAPMLFDIKTESGKLMLYQTTLCAITPWTEFNSSVVLDPHGYLESYNVNDIQLICCQADANSLWLVPDVIQSRFSQSLDKGMDMKFSWVLARDRPKNKEVVMYGQNLVPSDLPDPSQVRQVLEGSSNSFRINNTYPRYFRVTGSGDVRPFDQEANGVDGMLVLNRGESEWWSFFDISLLNSSVCGDLMGPMAIVVSEETPLGRFIRLQCSDLRMRIPFENLPSCDRLIAICEDIYAARAEGELGVEEVLYWTLVKIYRSPHMLLEYTNPD
ncbi:Piezo family [Cynara cardunculus var. scolymus]|uniref:Piezo family n=1 Tax=Cynara cardunculus var. scolymus TaxID=59895 RepID=A0A118K7M9_CYNCS|nr:Piezo family [Cynara cardunculus var. scolymus]